MHRLRVWVVTPEIHRRGGTERCIAEQVERWRDRFDIRLYTMRTEGIDLDGVALRKIPMPPGPHLVRYLWWLAAGRALRWWDARRLGFPDVVYSPGINAADSMAMGVHIVFAKYWERVGRRVVSDLLRPRSGSRALHRILYWRVLRVLERRIYSGAASIWAISSEDARELEGRFARPPGSVPVVPHGVDARWLSPEARAAARPSARKRLGVEGRRVMLLLGNDAYKKGVDAAVGSLRILPDEVVLAVAGRADTELIRGWAVKGGVSSRVLLWPHSSKVLDYYAASDVVVAPSREDAFHLPALEAMACGVPVVVSSRAGVAHLVENGRHALLLEDPENVDELAETVRQLLDDPKLTTRLSLEGRRLAERCDWDRNAERTAQLIEREIVTPRVLVLAADVAGRGGIERATRTLLEAFSSLYGGERVGLLTLGPAPGSAACRVLVSGGRRAGRIRRRHALSYLLRALFIARRWRENLVIVAAHPHLATVAWACQRASGAPFAVWCHGKEAWGGPPRAAVRATLRRADLVFAPSAYTIKEVQRGSRLPGHRLRLIPHCVPREVWERGSNHRVNQRKSSGRVVLSVARLAAQDSYKGVDRMIRVWLRVLARVPAAELWVVGDGEDRARLEATTRLLGLDRSVRFLGNVEDDRLRELYELAQAFALPSRFRTEPRPEGEGFGLVYVEAGATGLPVIAGRGGGTEQAVTDGDNGLLVNPDDPEELAEALIRLLTNDQLARRLGENGRRRAEHEFGYERFVEAIDGMIRELSPVVRESAPATR